MNLTTFVQSAGVWSYALVFALTAAETSAFVGVIMPGETLILVAAALAAQGALNPVLLAVVVVTGGIVGDSLGFALGRWSEHWHLAGSRPRRSGHGLLSTAMRRHRHRIERARKFLLRHGGAAVFAGRFIGFVRSFLPFAAGAAHMPYRRFLAYSAGASTIWGVGNVLVGYYTGGAAEEALRTVGLAGACVVGGLAAITLLVLRIRWRLSHITHHRAGA